MSYQLNAWRLGYTHGEGSTIHEFNEQMNLDARKAGGELYRIYRVYKRDLAPFHNHIT